MSSGQEPTSTAHSATAQVGNSTKAPVSSATASVMPGLWPTSIATSTSSGRADATSRIVRADAAYSASSSITGMLKAAAYSSAVLRARTAVLDTMRWIATPSSSRRAAIAGASRRPRPFSGRS